MYSVRADGKISWLIVASVNSFGLKFSSSNSIQIDLIIALLGRPMK